MTKPDDKPVFRVEKEALAITINTFRVKDSVHRTIVELSNRSNLPIQEIVRKMIDFAIEHMEQPK